VKLSLQLTGKQQEIILEECLYLIDSPCSELLGPGIRGSPRESLVPAGGPAIPRIIEVQERGPIWDAKICYRKAAI